MQIGSLNNKISYKLIIVCILMQLLLVSSISFAGDFTIQSGSNSEVSSVMDQSFYFQKDSSSLADEYSYAVFKPTQTGLYRINALKLIDFSTGYGLVSYRLDRVTNMQLSTKYTFTNVSLASEKTGDDVHFANVGNDAYRKDSISGWGGVKHPIDRAVYVVLDKNSLYAIRAQEDIGSSMIFVQVEKKAEASGATYGFSNNAPSAWITMGQKNLNINSADPQINGYPTMNVSAKKVNELIDQMSLEDTTNNEHAFQWLERILVYIIFTIGNTIIDLFEQALGLSRLTLDNLIFNKMANNANNPTIDLRPLRRNWKIFRYK